MTTPAEFKTVSERLFSEYLDEAKYPWEYEPIIDGQSKRPDFRIRHGGLEFFCDVKQRDANEWPTGAQIIDPYPGVRRLIFSGRKTFRHFSTQLCALVVFNEGDFYTRLDPFCVFGAMLGEPGIQFQFITESATLDADSAMSVFQRRRGAMIKHYEPLEVYESAKNISVVITLETHAPRNPDFQQALSEAESIKSEALDRPLTADEVHAIGCELIIQGLRYSLPERQRVIVCLNPFARQTFPDHLFKGDYDERWSIVDGSMQRIWMGNKCEHLEDEDDDEDGED